MTSLFNRKNSPFYHIRDGEFKKSLKTTDLATAKKLLLEFEYDKASETSNILHKKNEINDVFERYFKKRDMNGRSEKSVKFDKSRADKFLKFCELKKIKFIESVNESLLNDYFDLISGNKDSTVRRHQNTLLAIFNFAKLKNNPFKDIELKKPGKKLFRFLSIAEIKKLLKTAKNKMPELLEVAALGYYAGLRKSEIIFCESNDIDFKNKSVRVVNKPGFTIKDNEEREIPMSSDLKNILRQTIKRNSKNYTSPAIIKGKKHNCIARTRSGTSWNNNLDREFRKLTALAELENVSIQTLRETFGCHLIDKGVPIETISKLLGHSSIRVTETHYATVLTKRKISDIEKLNIR